ncbi:HisA/HisF-related TIM barrel protein [Flexithrix dorotheae]|uniref:1-(5-phosphoribosyl)-5-[(5- phosphoribosylamino)methylideneamino]imidazole-4- carboxamide isomerase n=1 Tax=Flexithrix dorotheae TaxID=70993 RepID=UPI00035D6B3C|nr:1-(5-phosphoribosyl)-5-[(5-phosphoribosylamino)methylideneamino] imidazole-4-carboxamide isomerase [Flexithrix dorotheae]
MIDIIPSLSVIGGKCVRLSQGDYKNKTVYDESPIDIAKKFEDNGITKIHLIDLEGAKAGRVINYDILELICGHTNLEVNFGGGINTDGDINKVFEYGAKMITVGSLAIKNKNLFTSWLISYGRQKVVLSADALDRKIQIKGWQKKTDIDLLDHIEYYFERSIQYVKCSDVSRDGLLQGSSIDIYKDILKKFPELKLFASGGVSSLDEIKALEEVGVHGVIVGKAIYEEQITLSEIHQFFAK